MNILAIDLGEKRTGLAWAQPSVGVPMSLETIEHQSFEDLQRQLLEVLEAKSIAEVVIGLPLLLSGNTGKQSKFVETFTQQFPWPESITWQFIDERYSSKAVTGTDKDAAAACHLLEVYLDRK